MRESVLFLMHLGLWTINLRCLTLYRYKSYPSCILFLSMRLSGKIVKFSIVITPSVTRIPGGGIGYFYCLLDGNQNHPEHVLSPF
jgi:hypothetical protein